MSNPVTISVPPEGHGTVDSGLYLSFVDVEGNLRRVPLETEILLIGRSRRCHLSFELLDVSRVHCRLVWRDGAFHLKDEGSRHGTFLNGFRVVDEKVVGEGDVIGIGDLGRIGLTIRAHNPIGDFVAGVLERSRVDAADSETSRYRDVLPSVLRALTSTLEMNVLLGMVLDAVLGLTSTTRGFLVLEEDGKYDIRVRRSSTPEDERSELSVGALERAQRTAMPVVLRGAEAIADVGGSLATSGLRAVACFPLRVFEGERLGHDLRTGTRRVLGVVHVDSRSLSARLGEEDVAFVQSLCDLVAVHLANAKLHERASKDALTGLHNRGSFDQSLAEQFARALATNRPLAVALIDLDHFKRINDTHGHAAGDTVLREVAKIFRSTLAGRGFPCRYGGEEFGILFPERTAADAGEIVEELREKLAARPLSHANGGAAVSIPITLSAGVAEVPGPGIKHPAQLLAAADAALYESKARGRNRVTVTAGSKPTASAAGDEDDEERRSSAGPSGA